MNDKILTLAEYSDQIIRPMVLNSIKSGSFDVVIKNAEERAKCLCVYSDDMEIIMAIVERYRFLNV